MGIDLAAEPKKTGVAWLEWDQGSARVADLQLGASDNDLVDAMSIATKSGIDCPLGWPREFVAFITRHQTDHVVVDPECRPIGGGDFPIA